MSTPPDLQPITLDLIRKWGQPLTSSPLAEHLASGGRVLTSLCAVASSPRRCCASVAGCE
jgi:hypothetical protein